MSLVESGEFIFTCSLESTDWSEMKQVNKDFNNWRLGGVKNNNSICKKCKEKRPILLSLFWPDGSARRIRSLRLSVSIFAILLNR